MSRLDDKLKALDIIEKLMDAEYKQHGTSDAWKQLCDLQSLVQRGW